LSELNRAGLILFAGVLGLVLFLYYLKTKPVVVRKMIGKIERFLPAKIAHSIDDILDSFIQGLSILHDPKILWKISYYSIGFWLLICAGFWAGVHAYYPNFAFFSTFLVMTLLALGVAVPTPGGIGSYHLACQLGLTRFFNVPEAQASAIALVSHALAFSGKKVSAHARFKRLRKKDRKQPNPQLHRILVCRKNNANYDFLDPASSSTIPPTSEIAPRIGGRGILFFSSAVASIGPRSITFSLFV
jgi:uncharacterized membrane protein YbhN (UPF0104 family)